MPRRQKRDENASRLETVPRWLWEVLDAAKAGNMYLRKFPAKNYAVNAMHRYHEFRRDAIREGYPGAEILTEMPCSWDKADPEKTTLIWVFIGNLADYAQVPSGRELAPQLTGAEGTAMPLAPRGLGDTSESEKMVETWFKRKPEMPSDLDIPALDLSPAGEQPPPCPPHELGEFDDTCIKCRWPVTKCSHCKNLTRMPCEYCAPK